jgi:FkbM family methyltransferase
MLMELDSRNWIDWNLLFRGDFEPHLTRLWSQLAPEGGVAIDIGANIGTHTLSMAKLVGARGRVLAFEPNPLVRSVLVHNLTLNRMEQVSVYGCALGSKPGMLPLRIPKRSSAEFSNMGLASLVALDTPHDLLDVEIQTLDDVLGRLDLDRVDVVKIDVQGYEVATLLGMRASLKRYRPVVIFEYEAWAWKQAHVQAIDAVELLQAAGYELFRLDEKAQAGVRPLGQGFQLPDHLDLLAMHAATQPWKLRSTSTWSASR